MDIFEGSPRQKFYDVIFAAPRCVVEDKIDELLARLVALEELARTSEQAIASHIATNDIQSAMQDLYIGTTAEILSRSE